MTNRLVDKIFNKAKILVAALLWGLLTTWSLTDLYIENVKRFANIRPPDGLEDKDKIKQPALHSYYVSIKTTRSVVCRLLQCTFYEQERKKGYYAKSIFNSEAK